MTEEAGDNQTTGEIGATNLEARKKGRIKDSDRGEIQEEWKIEDQREEGLEIGDHSHQPIEGKIVRNLISETGGMTLVHDQDQGPERIERSLSGQEDSLIQVVIETGRDEQASEEEVVQTVLAVKKRIERKLLDGELAN